jgi:rod shape-determining protein MreD
VRIALFYLILFVAQGLLGALFAPAPPPDLFLIAVLTLLHRVTPWQFVLVAYGIGLVQDVSGHGLIGLHAIGLAGAALVAGTIRAQLTQDGLLERSAAVLGAVLGKWLISIVLLLWLGGGTIDWPSVLPQIAWDVPLTILVALLALPLAQTLMARSRTMRKELL